MLCAGIDRFTCSKNGKKMSGTHRSHCVCSKPPHSSPPSGPGQYHSTILGLANQIYHSMPLNLVFPNIRLLTLLTDMTLHFHPESLAV